MFPPFLFPFLRPVPAAPDPRGGILALSSPPWSAPSRRTEDMSAEGQLGIFLDRYLYSRLEEAGRIRSFHRVRDRSGQLRGTDVILTAPEGGALRLDEKAQLYYLNRDLPTFAFELLFLRQGCLTPGWLCREGLDTDRYLLVWPFARRDRPKGIRWTDFTRVDCLLLDKAALLAWLSGQGLARERLLREAADLRRAGERRRDIPGLPDAYYVASDPARYGEAPVDLVIRRARLLSLPGSLGFRASPAGLEPLLRF